MHRIVSDQETPATSTINIRMHSLSEPSPVVGCQAGVAQVYYTYFNNRSWLRSPYSVPDLGFGTRTYRQSNVDFDMGRPAARHHQPDMGRALAAAKARDEGQWTNQHPRLGHLKANRLLRTALASGGRGFRRPPLLGIGAFQKADRIRRSHLAEKASFRRYRCLEALPSQGRQCAWRHIDRRHWPRGDSQLRARAFRSTAGESSAFRE